MSQNLKKPAVTKSTEDIGKSISVFTSLLTSAIKYCDSKVQSITNRFTIPNSIARLIKSKQVTSKLLQKHP